MEILLRLWFGVACAAVTVFAGWSVMQLGVTHIVSMLGMGVAALLALLATVRRSPHRSRYFPAPIPHIAVFFFGMFVAQTNPWNINLWMENSMTIVQHSVQPVNHFGGKMRAVLLTPSEEQRIANVGPKLTTYENDPGGKMLVSFGIGLAVYEDNTAHLLSATGVMLSTMLPDNSFLYYHPNDRWTTTRRVQTITRATIRNGKLFKIWERSAIGLYVHHWADEFEGTVYHPGRTFGPFPEIYKVKSATGAVEPCLEPEAIHDVIHLIDTETGEVRESIDMVPVIAELAEREPKLAFETCKDPLHLNDVQVLKTLEQARMFPSGKVGDMIVSMRNINTIALIDHASHDVKWHVTGLFVHQHSPRVTERGTMLVFDNLGSDKANGRSRILEIDIRKRATVGLWEATGTDAFHSQLRGKVLERDGKLLIFDQNVYEPTNSMFTLDCPSFPISLQCKREPVFVGKAPEFLFDNAAFFH